MPISDGQIALHKNCPAFTITGKWEDYPRASVKQVNKHGTMWTHGHLVYEDDEWIVLRAKGTVQYEIRKDTPGTTVVR